MRRAISLMFLLLCAGLFATVSLRAEEAAGDEKPTVGAKKGKMTSIKGEITEIDTAGNVKVKEKDEEITISVTDKTIITAGKIKRAFSDLKAGDKIVAKFTEEDGKRVARSIRVATVGKGEEKKQPEPKAAAPATEAPQSEPPQQ